MPTCSQGTVLENSVTRFQGTTLHDFNDFSCEIHNKKGFPDISDIPNSKSDWILGGFIIFLRDPWKLHPAAVGQLVQRPRAPTQLCSAGSLHPNGCPAERWSVIREMGLYIYYVILCYTTQYMGVAWGFQKSGYSWMVENGKSDYCN